MVQANQSGGIKKSKAFGADAAPAHKTDGDVTRSSRDRDKSDRAGTRSDEQTSKRAKGVGKLTLVPIDAIRADPRNPRKHSRIQVRAIARSIDAFGFNAPILVDKRNQIVAGHGRYEAAQLLGLDRIPVISRRARESNRGSAAVNSALRNDLGAVRIDGARDGRREASERDCLRHAHRPSDQDAERARPQAGADRRDTGPA